MIASESGIACGQLRSYIAPGAPATRTPCDGTETDLRVEFGFTPRWYHQHLGIDFTERWHVDPLYRHASVVSMRHELNRRFPGLRLGGDDPVRTTATLDGVHGAVVVSSLFGIPAEYYADNWPAATHAYLSEKQIASLDVPAVADNPVMCQILEQMDVIEREFGRIEGYLNWQGVLNNAYRIRGPELFADLLANAALAHHLFEIVAQTMIAGMRFIYDRQAKSGVVVRHATVSNCLVNMVSPEIYREHLRPYDARIAVAFPLFGIHNCAWNVDPYIADYAAIHPLGYVDMGLESNLECARRLCPDARRAVMYTPKDLLHKSPDLIRRDLTRIARELGPCDVVMADIDYETPDERVLLFAQIVAQILQQTDFVEP